MVTSGISLTCLTFFEKVENTDLSTSDSMILYERIDEYVHANMSDGNVILQHAHDSLQYEHVSDSMHMHTEQSASDHADEVLSVDIDSDCHAKASDHADEVLCDGLDSGL